MIRLLFALALAVAPVATDNPTVAWRITDPRITESSGLVDTGSAMFTVNDSGHDPVLFRLDPDTGETTATIRFADAAVDVEALAPDVDPDVVWVGDIGDNSRRRDHIELHRVAVDTGATQRRELRYPDGPRDAEALVVDRSGRAYVVSKDLAGEVYVAEPGASDLVPVARVGMFITDAALLPDQRHVLLRDYGNLHLYTFPAFDRVASMALPRQPQGEGLSVSPDGRVRISSEGADQPVHEIALSAEMSAALAEGSTPSATPSPTPSPQVSAGPTDAAGDDGRDSPTWDWPAWVWAGVVLAPLACLVAVGAALRNSRRRS